MSQPKNIRFNRFTRRGYTPENENLQVSVETEILELSVSTLQHWLSEIPDRLVLVDVRYPNEYAIDHLPNAVSIPFPQLCQSGIAHLQTTLDQWQVEHPGQEYRLVVYCTAGVRSAQALERLQPFGIQGFNLRGGMQAWHQETAAEPDDIHHTYAAQTRRNGMSDVQLKRGFSVRFPQFGWLQAGVCTAALLGGVVGWLGYRVIMDPDHLRPMIKAGVPVNVLANAPVIGDAVLAAQVPQIDVKDLKQRLDRHDSSLVVMDVRTPKEFQDSHIPGAVSVPLDDIKTGVALEQVRSLAKDHHIVAYCSYGYRSGKALAELHRHGIDGMQVKGGWSAWEKEFPPSHS